MHPSRDHLTIARANTRHPPRAQL